MNKKQLLESVSKVKLRSAANEIVKNVKQKEKIVSILDALMDGKIPKADIMKLRGSLQDEVVMAITTAIGPEEAIKIFGSIVKEEVELDKTAETKPSKYTKKYHELYGENVENSSIREALADVVLQRKVINLQRRAKDGDKDAVRRLDAMKKDNPDLFMKKDKPTYVTDKEDTNIIMQLRSAKDLKGNKVIQFRKGKSKVDLKDIEFILNFYDKLNTQGKRRLQLMAGQSYDTLKKLVKEYSDKLQEQDQNIPASEVSVEMLQNKTMTMLYYIDYALEEIIEYVVDYEMEMDYETESHLRQAYRSMQEVHAYLEGEARSLGLKEEVELDEQAPVAPVLGQKWKSYAVVVHKDSKQRIVVDRKHIKNYPEHEGWKEISPGQRVRKEEVELEESYMWKIEGGTGKGKYFGDKKTTVDDHLSAMKYHSTEYQRLMKQKKDSDARHHGMKYHKHKDQIERLGNVGNVHKEQLEEASAAARFNQKVKQAQDAHQGGRHKNAKMHLDTARTFMLGVKSTDMSKIKDSHKVYNDLRKLHENIPLEEDQIDETSKQKLKSYIDVASTDVFKKGYKSGQDSSIDHKKTMKRLAGIYKATTKLAKEETEINEAEKIACLGCDEVSTAKSWQKNRNFCPKCKKSNRGVREETEINEKVDKSSPIYKEYIDLKKLDTKTIRKMLSDKYRGPFDASGLNKEASISQYLRDKHGDKRVDSVFESDINEGVMYDRYIRAHGKKPKGGTQYANWAFTTKRYDRPNKDEMVFAKGSLNAAAKEAAKKLGVKVNDLYVMEEIVESASKFGVDVGPLMNANKWIKTQSLSKMVNELIDEERYGYFAVGILEKAFSTKSSQVIIPTSEARFNYYFRKGINKPHTFYYDTGRGSKQTDETISITGELFIDETTKEVKTSFGKVNMNASTRLMVFK